MRPLLDCTKSQLESVCNDAGLRFVTDPSNEDLSFLRARVRRMLTRNYCGGGTTTSLVAQARGTHLQGAVARTPHCDSHPDGEHEGGEGRGELTRGQAVLLQDDVQRRDASNAQSVLLRDCVQSRDLTHVEGMRLRDDNQRRDLTHGQAILLRDDVLHLVSACRAARTALESEAADLLRQAIIPSGRAADPPEQNSAPAGQATILALRGEPAPGRGMLPSQGETSIYPDEEMLVTEESRTGRFAGRSLSRQKSSLDDEGVTDALQTVSVHSPDVQHAQTPGDVLRMGPGLEGASAFREAAGVQKSSTADVVGVPWEESSAGMVSMGTGAWHEGTQESARAFVGGRELEEALQEEAVGRERPLCVRVRLEPLRRASREAALLALETLLQVPSLLHAQCFSTCSPFARYTPQLSLFLPSCRCTVPPPSSPLG